MIPQGDDSENQSLSVSNMRAMRRGAHASTTPKEATAIRKYFRALRGRRLGGELWDRRFTDRLRIERRALIRSREFPVVGCHLAAIELQRFFRGVSVRLAMGRSGDPDVWLSRACKAALRAKKLRADARKPRKENVLRPGRRKATAPAAAPAEAPVACATTQQTDLSLVSRFLDAKVRSQLDGESGFRVWALIRMQAFARMVPMLLYRRTVRWTIFSVAALSLQRGWRRELRRRAARRRKKPTPVGTAAQRIQRKWQARGLD